MGKTKQPSESRYSPQRRQERKGETENVTNLNIFNCSARQWESDAGYVYRNHEPQICSIGNSSNVTKLCNIIKLKYSKGKFRAIISRGEKNHFHIAFKGYIRR
jgi:hypothetical protein